MLPQAIPWLILLGLLALPQNRNPQTWWIWAPIFCAFALPGLIRAAGSILPGQPLEVFASAMAALSFGLASLWLVSTTRKRQSRFKTFLLGLLVVGGLGVAAHAVGRLGDLSGELVPEGIILLMCAIIIPGALSVGGVLCRRRYRPVALLIGTLFGAGAVTLLIVLPFFALAMMSNSGPIAWSEFFVGVGLLAGVSFAIILPFLLLAFGNSVFRDRLQSLLQLGALEKPTVLQPDRALEMQVG